MNIRTISIPVLHPRGGFLSEMISLVADGFRDLGFDVSVVEDGAESSLEADLVLLFGDLVRLRGTLALLTGANARPATSVWQMDPLPSPDLSTSALRRGLDAAARREVVRERLSGGIGRSIRRLAGRSLLRLRSVTNGDRGRVPVHFPRHQALFDRLSLLRKSAEDGVLDTIAVSSSERVDVLAGVGVPADFVPMGFHPSMGENLDRQRDVESIFLGRVSDRRGQILRRVQAELGEEGMRLQIEKGFYGVDRTRLLNSAMTILGPLHSGDYWELSRTRLIQALACGTLPICEQGPDTAPFKPGVHFVSAPSQRLAEAVVEYSLDHSARDSLVTAGRAFVTTELTMQKSLRALHPDLVEPSLRMSSEVRR